MSGIETNFRKKEAVKSFRAQPRAHVQMSISSVPIFFLRQLVFVQLFYIFSTGPALTKRFKITFADWLDEGEELKYPGPGDPPLDYQPVLRYRVQYRPRGSVNYAQLVPTGEAAIIEKLQFAIGPEAQNYTFELLFTVLDKYDGIAERHGTVQVKYFAC